MSKENFDAIKVIEKLALKIAQLEVDLSKEEVMKEFFHDEYQRLKEEINHYESNENNDL